MKTYNVSRLPSMLCIGFDGENNWRPQAFDCTPLLQNHPNGTISLWLLPNGETQAFPVALERDGNTVVWTPLSEEMTAATGALQLVCTDGTDVGKSAVVMFRVDESILPGADHPAAVPSWATQTIERAESAADRAEEAAESIDVDHLEQIIAAAVEAYLIEHPIESPVQSVNGKTGAVVLDAEDVGALPADTPIPAAVTEQTVSGWGFTKNTGTYSKPSGGIPASDLAPGVIPVVPQMATQTDMSDWTSGKTVDAAALKTDFQFALQQLDGKASQDQVDAIGLRVDDLDIDVQALQNAGYQTAQDVQTAIAGVRQLPAVTASDNGKFLRVVNGAWAAETVPAAESNSFLRRRGMADYIIQDSTLEDIADAIRAKTGGSAAMTPAEMVTEIGNIPTGGGVSKVTSITLAAELNSYNILQAMGAKLYYQNSIVSMYVIGDTAAVGGANYTNNNYTMVHKGTTVLKGNARYSFLDQYPSRIAPTEIYIGKNINASRYVASDAFVNADGSFSFRRTTATILAPIGATCVLIETPLLDSAGNFDITPFST